MKFAGLIAVVLALLLTGAVVPAAGAETLTASGGGVTAKVTFTAGTPATRVSSPQITLTQAGGASYSGAVNQRYCGGGYCEGPTLTVADLDGQHDPVAAVFTGGAHCCSIASVYWQDAGGRWRSVRYDFGDPGFRLKDLNHDGQDDFLTADDRFAYLLTAYAASGLPIRILSFAHGAFNDVTGDYPALVERDAAGWWKAYQRDHSGGQIGQLAPWAADEDVLGNAATVASTLSAQVARGRVTAGQAQKLRYYLKKFGYTQ